MAPAEACTALSIERASRPPAVAGRRGEQNKLKLAGHLPAAARIFVHGNRSTALSPGACHRSGTNGSKSAFLQRRVREPSVPSARRRKLIELTDSQEMPGVGDHLAVARGFGDLLGRDAPLLDCSYGSEDAPQTL